MRDSAATQQVDEFGAINHDRIRKQLESTQTTKPIDNGVIIATVNQFVAMPPDRRTGLATTLQGHDNGVMPTLEDSIREYAKAIGFSLVGIARATNADDFQHLQEWLVQGFAGEMAYMRAQAQARRHPASIFPDVRTVIMVTMEYSSTEAIYDQQSAESPPAVAPGGEGTVSAKVSRYARGADYHRTMWRKLDKLLAWLKTEVPHCSGRGVVDTAPLLERDFARRAGLGWIGKNTMLINKERGSYFFIGALLTNLELQPDKPHELEHCGTCTACLDACPTNAFASPGSLDARRCISYLTIELRGAMPEDLRSGVGDWMFGCDICQEVCPWNRRDESSPQIVDAIAILQMSPDGYRNRFGATALSRAKRQGLARNAAIVLGNSGDERCVPALELAQMDPDAAVREAATWALAQIQDRHASPAVPRAGSNCGNVDANQI